ncbi:ubiquitin carboxyl-terminal hydrolase isozyme L3-like [Dysidea avara]|uniref:ubiquitin carboxyl-terminal hydrolase isozyme L3-like n=1 Tax=Dysidea avara TaxID=196820 RepID=UPI00331A41B7
MADAGDDPNKRRWLPLESNPDVMNKYVKGLGMKPDYQFVDVFGMDPDLLAMIPQPCSAMLLLFPINDKVIAHEKEVEERIKKDGQVVSAQVYFMKQTVGNACGTVGLLHSLGNNLDSITLGDGYLKTFFEKTKNMSPEERAQFLEADDEIAECHEVSAQEGQTEAPPRDDHTNLHFISFVHKDGHLYELDGRKDFPVNHGATTAANFVQDAAKVVQQFMARDPTEVHFTVVALAKTD